MNIWGQSKNYYDYSNYFYSDPKYYGSAILSGKTVHFHGANIVKVNRK